MRIRILLSVLPELIISAAAWQYADTTTAVLVTIACAVVSFNVYISLERLGL